MGFFFNGINIKSQKVRRLHHRDEDVFKNGKRFKSKQSFNSKETHKSNKNKKKSASRELQSSSVGLSAQPMFGQCFPNEIYFEFISNLKFDDLRRLRLVNKKFHHLIDNIPRCYILKLIRTNIIIFRAGKNKETRVQTDKNNPAITFFRMLDIDMLGLPFLKVEHFQTIEFDGFLTNDGDQQHSDDKKLEVPKIEILDFPNRFYLNNIRDEKSFEMIKYFSKHKNLKFVNVNRLINNLLEIYELQSKEGIVDVLFEKNFELLVKECSINENLINEIDKYEGNNEEIGQQNSNSDNQKYKGIHSGKLTIIDPILASLKIGKFQIFEILIDLIDEDFKREIHDKVLKFAINSKDEKMIDFLISCKTKFKL